MLRKTRTGKRACAGTGSLDFGAGDIAGRWAGGSVGVALFALCLVLTMMRCASR